MSGKSKNLTALLTGIMSAKRFNKLMVEKGYMRVAKVFSHNLGTHVDTYILTDAGAVYAENTATSASHPRYNYYVDKFDDLKAKLGLGGEDDSADS